MHIKQLFSVYKLLMLILFIGFSSAYACMPLPGAEPLSIAQKAQESAFVFEGVVTAITDTYVLVKVGQYFKGKGLDEVKISGFNRHSCSDFLTLGQRALFFTTGAMGEVLEAVYDGAFGSIRAFNSKTLAEINASRTGIAK